LLLLRFLLTARGALLHHDRRQHRDSALVILVAVEVTPIIVRVWLLMARLLAEVGLVDYTLRG
jgi:hypothetical protein